MAGGFRRLPGSNAGGSTMANGTSGADTFTAPAGASTFNGLGGVDTLILNFALVDATFAWVGNQLIIDTASSHTVTTGFEVFQFTDGTVHNDDGNPLVDDLFDYAKSHDVWNAHVDADAHYMRRLAREARPERVLQHQLYLASIRTSQHGRQSAHAFPSERLDEGRDPGPTSMCRNICRPIRTSRPRISIRWRISSRRRRRRTPAVPGRSRCRPRTASTTLLHAEQSRRVAAGVDPFQHFQTFGWKEGRNPNAYFDMGLSRDQSGRAAAGVNPLDHSIIGWPEGRNPSPASTSRTICEQPDVAAAHVDPLKHSCNSASRRAASPMPSRCSTRTAPSTRSSKARRTAPRSASSVMGRLDVARPDLHAHRRHLGRRLHHQCRDRRDHGRQRHKVDFETRPATPTASPCRRPTAARPARRPSSSAVGRRAGATRGAAGGSVDELAGERQPGRHHVHRRGSERAGVGLHVTNDAGGRFTIDRTGDVRVANGAAIDFETAPGHAYTVTAKGTVGARARRRPSRSTSTT